MKDQAEKSRFKTHLQKQAYKNVLLASLGIVLVIILLIIFGTNILVSFSLLVGKLTGTEEAATTTETVSYIAPPTLDIPPEATSSAKFAITGFGEPDQKVELYRNDKAVAKTTVKNNNSFRFGNVTLVSGVNTFKAKTISTDNKSSEFSNEVTISLLNKQPELSINEPQEGAIYKKSGGAVRVAGKTDPGVKVTVNDFWAIVDDEGNYTYMYTLKDGENELKIVATDDADNKTEKSVKIKAE
jgi:bacillopeptidase F